MLVRLDGMLMVKHHSDAFAHPPKGRTSFLVPSKVCFDIACLEKVK